MENRYRAVHFEFVTNFLRELSKNDRAKILAGISKMEQGDFRSAYVKTLRGAVQELIVKQYRVLFFIHEDSIYLVRAFRKKSMKAPMGEIEHVERVHRMFINNW